MRAIHGFPARSGPCASRRGLPRGILAAALLAGALASAQAAEHQLLLDVVRNGQPLGKIGEFTDRDGELFAAAEELRSLGIAVPPGSSGQVALRSLRGLRFERDDAAQQIRVTADNAALIPNQLGPPAQPYAAPEAGWGGLLNYDLLGTMANGRSLGAGFLEGRAFSPFGTFSASMLAFTSRQGSQAPAIRLDTAFVHDDVETMRRYTLGDFISGGLSWSRPVRMGGVQAASHFGIRPDLVTSPVPTISGSAAVPSSVDVLVNGVRQFSGTTEPGPFAVRQLPIFTGAGEVSVVVRDALGRETTNTLPFYGTGSLLAAGLAAYSGEAGFVRRSYGLRSDDYREPAFNGTLRYGITDWITAESHVEVGSRLAMGGGGATLGLGMFGIASAAAAVSSPRSAAATRSGAGWQVAAGFERASRRLSLAGSLVIANRDFNDLAGLAGASVPRRVARASIGLPLGRAGTLAVAVVNIQNGERRVGDGIGLGTVSGNASIGSLTYTTSLFDRATIYATAYKDFSRTESYGATFGLSFALDARRTTNASLGNDRSGTYAGLQASQSATRPGEWGWRVYDTEGSLDRHVGEVEYRAQSARLTAGVDQTRSDTALRAGVQGALAMLGGGMFASNLIQDSFAVVDAGLPRVAVLQENRMVGHTDGGGRLLVPGLRSYDNNRLAIGAENLPIDASVTETSRIVRPLERSGVLVRFPISRGASARLRLVDAAGKDLPVGSAARLEGTGAVAPIGHGGETFFDGLAARNRLTVTLPGGGRCGVGFEFQASQGNLPSLGPFTCQ